MGFQVPGPFDCVTDWFQVRQLSELQPEENCSSAEPSAISGAGFTVGVALRNSSAVNVWWDFSRMKRRASEILLWLIAATLKAMFGITQRGGGEE